jgi:hypothetical protein
MICDIQYRDFGDLVVKTEILVFLLEARTSVTGFPFLLRILLVPGQPLGERECCLLVLNLVSSTLPCIRQPRPRLRVLDVRGSV